MKPRCQGALHLVVFLVVLKGAIQSTPDPPSSSTSSSTTAPTTTILTTTIATTTASSTSEATTTTPSTTTTTTTTPLTTTVATTTTTTTTTSTSTLSTTPTTTTTSATSVSTPTSKSIASTPAASTSSPTQPEPSVTVVVDSAASSREEDLKKENLYLKIGLGVLAGIIGLEIIAVLIYCFLRRRRRRSRPPFLTSDEDEPTFRHEKRGYFRPSSSFDPSSAKQSVITTPSETEPMTAKLTRDMDMQTFTFKNGNDVTEKKPIPEINDNVASNI